MNFHSDTICAIATPLGTGAIAIVRISGPRALSISNSIFSSKDLSKVDSHTVHFGRIRDQTELIDEVLLTVFKGGRSYTGEDAVEISCHASPYILKRLLELLVDKGARIAQPGEFSMRAFANGKLDLAQAEAVADLIASESKAAHQLAMQQMRGGFSSEIKDLREKLIDFASLIELELDFGEEDVEFADRDDLKLLVNEIQQKISHLVDSFSSGKVIKNGIPVAIIGEPNVGKSTLLNAILKEDKAIVSEIAGTTRDVIEDTVHINGMLFRFIDTAGIRETTDTIESLGILKTFEKVDQAQVIFYLTDALNDPAEKIQQMLQELQAKIKGQEKQLFVIANKVDKAGLELSNIPEAISEKYRGIENVIYISALKNIGVEELVEALSQIAREKLSNTEGSIISNARHYAALKATAEALQRVVDGLNNNITGDFLAMDIRQSMRHLGEITGEIEVDRDILGNIFGKFCIGK